MSTLRIVLILFAANILSNKKPYQPLITNKTQQYYKPLATFNGDTSAYLLDNFVTHQQYYLNKPLNVLLKQLEVPVVKCMASFNGGDAEEGCRGLYLYFYPSRTIDKKVRDKKEPAVLVINFKKLLQKEPINSFLMKNTPIAIVMRAYNGQDTNVGNISYVKY